MSHPSGNLPDPETLARAPAGRRCEQCPTVLSIYNPGPLCRPCQEREQMDALDGPPRQAKAPGEPVIGRQRILRSILPATLAEVREVRPGVWPHSGAGDRKLSRDLAAIGARPDGSEKSPGSVWVVQPEADEEAAEIAKARAAIRQVEELELARRERAPRRRGRRGLTEHILARARAAREEEP